MRKSTRAALAAAATLALVGGIPATAVAGERGGNGEPITVNGHSACAYSGLEDQDLDHNGTFDAPVVPGEVQNWGILGPQGRAFLLGISPLFHPGNSCNPNGEPPPEP